MEEIKRRIDYILINGLITTSNDTGIYLKQVYSETRLAKIVGTYLEEYVFEGFGSDIKEWFGSNLGNVEMCTSTILTGDLFYTYVDAKSNNEYFICHDCFLHSKHLNLPYKPYKSTYLEISCDCGTTRNSKRYATCCKHSKTRQSKVLPEAFLNKFGNIIQYLCEILEDICTNNVSVISKRVDSMIDAFLHIIGSYNALNSRSGRQAPLQNLEVDANARKSCLIVLDDDTHDLNEFIDFFKNALNISEEGIKAAASDLDKYGYSCVRYQSDFYECQRAKESIKRWPSIVSNCRTVNCRIAKVYHHYFMRLTPILIGTINKLCFWKTQLCELLLEIVFIRTSLAKSFVVNEHLLWKDLRDDMIIRILRLAKFFDSGKIYAAGQLINNIQHLYTHFISNHCKNNFSFISLSQQIVSCPSVVLFVVENGFLCKMIDVFSHLLKNLGIEAGADVVKIYKSAEIKRTEFSRVLVAHTLLCSCLQLQIKDVEVSSKFRLQLSEAGKRMVQFCLDFDDMQPSQKLCKEKTDRKDFHFLISLFESILLVVSQLTRWLVCFNEVALNTIKVFLDRFTMEIKNMSDVKPGDHVTHKIITGWNFNAEKFSIFNMSHRVFIDILMDVSIKGTLPQDVKDQIFGDENMLMWIARPAIIALSSFANYIFLKSEENHPNLRHHLYIYRKSSIIYLYVQDFNTIQILISHLDPELFLKYMLFNMAPSIQKRVDLLKPISSILRSTDLEVGLNLRHVLLYVYNALIERHYVGIQKDPEYQLLERQFIHSLALGQVVQENGAVAFREIFMINAYCPELNNAFVEIGKKVSFTNNSPGTQNKISLDYFYLNSINVFYFMYHYSDCNILREKLTDLYKTKRCRFQLPEFVELREDFEGMNNFIFSDSFDSLMMHVLLKWHKNSEPNKDAAVDNLLLVSMCICLILKMSLYQKNYSRLHKTIDFIFGIRKDLGGNSVITLLALLKTSLNNDILSAIFNYFLYLSQIPFKYFDDLPINPSNVMNKSKECLELALKRLQNQYREIHVCNESVSLINGLSLTDRETPGKNK